MAECELLTADMPAAELRLSRLAERARSRHDYCVVTRLRITLYTNWDKSDRATRRVPGVAPPRRHRLVEASDP